MSHPHILYVCTTPPAKNVPISLSFLVSKVFFAGYRADAGDQHPGAGDHEEGEGAGQLHQEAGRGREVQARENCRGH